MWIHDDKAGEVFLCPEQCRPRVFPEEGICVVPVMAVNHWVHQEDDMLKEGLQLTYCWQELFQGLGIFIVVTCRLYIEAIKAVGESFSADQLKEEEKSRFISDFTTQEGRSTHTIVHGVQWKAVLFASKFTVKKMSGWKLRIRSPGYTVIHSIAEVLKHHLHA